MLYDAYKQKIQRLAAVRRFLWKWKVPLIVVLSLLVAFVTTYICLKGKITQNVSLVSDTVTYGETPELNGAKAMLGGVKGYEYRAEGDKKWSKTVPKKAGTYYVRAVTGGAFGKRKGKSVLFTILPRAATVGVAADQTVTYGENPAALEASFIDGDTLIISELAFLYDDITQAETQVRVQTESIRVLNAAGENVTDCYTYTAVKSAIRFLPREITVQPAAQESTYSGAPILPVNEPSAIVERNLRFGAKMEFSSTVEDAFGNRMQSVVNAGNYTVRADVGSVRITVNGKDVTHLYAPQFADNGNAFTVLPRALAVTTGSDKKPYDGAPLACHTFTAQGQAQGHSVQLRSGATGATQTVVGSTPNAFAAGDFTVTDGEKDTTANYDITVQYGTLTVEKRPLSVFTASDSRIYSGAYYSRAEISSDGVAFAAALALSNGQTVYVDMRSFVASVCDFGTAENRFAVRVRDAYYNDTTAYYDITYTYGTLAVQKRSVTITTASASKSYDGTPLYAPDLTATDCENIVFGHTLRAVGVKASITDAGSTENKTQYAIYNGNTDVSGNYSIAYSEVYGTLSVTPRQVTIQPTATKIYDGTEKFGNEHIADIYPFGTPNDRKFVGNQMPTLSWKYTDTGEHVNVISGGYSVVLDSYTGNASCNVQNYEIVAYRGTLTVEKRTVRVVPQDLRFTYGDAIHMQPRWTYATDSLHFVGAQEPTLIWACRQGGTPETAGAYNLYLERAEDNAGTDFSANNYNIETTRDATLTVDPREVHLQLTGGTKVYNGKADADHAVKFDEGDTPPALSYAGISAGDTEQAQAHKFLDKDNMREFYIYYTAKDGAYVTPADVGEYYVRMAYLDADPFYYSSNYKIIEDNVGQATLTVTPRSVTVRAEDIGGGTDTVYYNGAVYGATIGYTVTGGTGFVAGEMPVLVWEFVPKQGYEDRKAGEDAGEYFIRYTGAQANGDFLPENYTIQNADSLGTLTITPRQVTVRPSGYKFYDGTEIFGDANIVEIYPYGAGEEQKFVSGQMPLFAYAYTDEGEHKNAGRYSVMCKAASSATCDLRNYAVTMQTFMFYVFARPINIVPENFTRTYSGQAVRAENIAWRYNNSEYLFLEEPSLVWEFYEEPINAGTYAFFLQSWQDNPATGFLKVNYDVQAYDGTLTIDPLTVYVRAADFSAEKNVHVKEYDGGGNAEITYAYTTAAQFVAGDIPTLIWRFTDAAGNEVALRNAGEYRVYYSRAENDGNYTIVGDGFGTYKITPRAVTIAPLAGQSKTYDGTGDFSVAYSTAGGTGFLTGEIPDVTWEFDAAPLNVGTYTITGCSTENNRNAYFLASNYSITCDTAVTVEVTPRFVALQADDVGNGVNRAYYNGAAYDKSVAWQCTDDTSFVAGETPVLLWQYVQNGTAVLPVHAGVYEIEFVRATEQEGNAFRTENYVIANADPRGTLTISPRPVTVKANDIAITYDGNEHTPDIGNGWQAGGMGFVAGEAPELYWQFTQDGKAVTPKNAGAYKIEFAYAIGQENNAFRNANYDISDADLHGTLTIGKLTVYVRAADFSAEKNVHVKEYDGGGNAEIAYAYTTAAQFVAGDIPTLIWRYTDTAGNAKELRNAGEYRIYFDHAENDGNYDVQSDGFGTYKIMPYDFGKAGRNFRIVTNSASRVFNGQPLTDSGFTATVSEDFPAGHAFVVTGELPYAFYPFKADNVTPDTVTNELRFMVCDERGEDATANFADFGAIAYTYGELQVLPQIFLYATASTKKVYNGFAWWQDGSPTQGVVYDGTKDDASVTLIENFRFDARVEKVVRLIDNKGNAVSGTENVPATEAGKYRVYYSVVALRIGEKDYTHIGLQIVKTPQENGLYYFDFTVEHSTIYVRAEDVTLPYTGDPMLSLSGSDGAYWEVFYGDAIADRQTFTIDDSDRLDIRVAGWAYVGIVSGRVTSADGATDYSDNYRIYTAGNYAASGRELSEFQGILQVQRKQLAYTRNDTAVTVAGDSEFAYNGNAHAVKIVLANGATPVVADLFDFDTAQLPDGHSVVLESVSGTSVGTQALLLKFRILNERGENVTKAFFMQTHREDAISITVRKAELSIDTTAGIRVASEGRSISPFITEEDGSEVYRLTDKNYLRVSVQENGVVAYSVYRIADGVEIEGYETLYYSVTVNGVLMQSEQEETL